MNSGYIVELAGDAIGLLVSAGSSFEFHAVDTRFRSLEGATFDNGFAAERAAKRLVRRGPGETVRRGRRQYSLLDGSRFHLGHGVSAGGSKGQAVLIDAV